MLDDETWTICCPRMRAMRSWRWNWKLATVIDWLPGSGEDKANWALDEVYEHRRGRLLDWTGAEMNPEVVDFEDFLGADAGRQIRKYCERADGLPRRRLNRSSLPFVMTLWFAVQIDIGRHWPPV